MYEEDQVIYHINGLHSLLCIWKELWERLEIEEITQTMREMAADGEVQLVGPDLYVALPERGWRAHRETPETKRRRAIIQRMWNVDGASARSIAACLGSREETIAQTVAQMRQQGYTMLKHRKGGGLAETLVSSG